ncbi:hypothetical protein, partial [Kingella oralis]|uniref:hypothetical protein n=1 Tax=Kingella oralis TaxID=505 RepID=UPI003C700BD5
RRVGNSFAHQNMVREPWWANELPTLRLNAGAMVRQPENLPRAPTACWQAVRWLKIRRQPETKNTVSGCLCPTRIKAA